MISIAGIRGIVGDSLRLEDYLRYARAFMADLKPRRLVVGGDTRRSGDMLRHLVFAAAIDAGLEVMDLGIVPTPTVGMMVRHYKAGGGIAITASHNPPQWNALKFFSEQGSFLSPERFRKLLDNERLGRFRSEPVERLGSVTTVFDPIGVHLDSVLKILPVKAIRARTLRVVLDACNGAGLGLAQELFKELGVTMGVILQDPTRAFERKPEPLPENLARLKNAVRRFKADLGFAIDPDADRLAIVDESGHAIGEERTIVLAAEYFLRHYKSAVVVNLSTTRAVEDVAARHGSRVYRTPIGEAHVIKKMKSSGAQIGGEGNGGVIDPRVHPGRDAATGMGLILALLTEERRRRSGTTLSAINATIPDYVMVKDHLRLSDRGILGGALKKIREQAGELGDHPGFNTMDGLKIDLGDCSLHVRASGTEPIVRLFAEAPTRGRARRLVDWAKGRF